MHIHQALLVFTLLVILSNSCFGYKDYKSKKKASNTVIGVNATCTAEYLEVIVHMEVPFSGVLYSRGFPLECRGLGTGDREARLRLPTSGCGVQLSMQEDGEVLYKAVVDVQLDRHLQQASDQQRKVVCSWRRTSDKPVVNKQTTRTGRKMAAKHIDEAMLQKIKDSRAWLEIKGLDYPGSATQVSVGELTTLVVKSRLPGGIGSRVVECAAHDGAGDLQQRLLDTRGCPVDDVIMPGMEYTRPEHGKHSMGGLHVATAEFAAFKFPDRNSLHLSCIVQLCRGDCPDVDCSRQSANNTGIRTNRNIKGPPGELLDRLVVFNSVEVLAPGIDSDEESDLSPRYSSDFDASFVIQGERAVCLSPNKMALAFGVLGLIFLAAVAVALYMLLRGRRKHRSKHMLLNDDSVLVHDSPMLGMQQHRNAWPFVRVFH